MVALWVLTQPLLGAALQLRTGLFSPATEGYRTSIRLGASVSRGDEEFWMRGRKSQRAPHHPVCAPQTQV